MAANRGYSNAMDEWNTPTKQSPDYDGVYFEVKSGPPSPTNHLSVPLPEAVPPKAEFILSPATSEGDIDPWALPELQDQGAKWSDLDRNAKIKRCIINILKIFVLIGLLYIFICSLDFLSSSFRLLGGKVAGSVFSNNEHLKNPVVGLMIGVLATVLVQSSSTSTSIIVTMVGSNMLDVPTAIPIIMGSNIGTSVTNTLVSLAQSGDRNEFRRAFGGATVHDMFNWLSVGLLLPLEVATGYLYHLTTAIVDSMEWSSQEGANKEMLTVLTKPFTELIIQLDKKVVEDIALNKEEAMNKSLIKEWCKYSTQHVLKNFTIHQNVSDSFDGTSTVFENEVTEQHYVEEKIPLEKCQFLLRGLGISDMFVGLILLVISLVLLCGCLVLMVKVLHSMLKGQIAVVIRKTLNSDFPGPLACLTGYIAILVGCLMTILVQSSSIFTSALTPLVGLGVISIERMYPLTLGSNIGTTTTGVLASLTATGDRLRYSIQIALCHLFFNLSGIAIFYPIPFMRFPIQLARGLGNITAKYRWFSVLYLILMFFVVPTFVFLMSLGGAIVMMCIGIPLLVLFVFVIIVNIMQGKCAQFLPPILRSWDFLPLWMHSLEPVDQKITKIQRLFGRCCKCCRKGENLADLYNMSFHSQTAILKGGSIQAFPSTNTLNMKTLPGQAYSNPGSGIVFTSAV